MTCRFLTPADLPRPFADVGFVALPDDGYRTDLSLRPEIATTQRRIGARPPDVTRLPYLVRATNLWLPDYQPRLMWISHMDEGGDAAFAIAARAGLGETRSIGVAPGCLFDARSWGEDELKRSEDHRADLGLLAGFATSMFATSADGWLIAGGCADRIEFWQGNLFFHAKEESRLADAEAMLDEFGCSRDLI